MVDQCISAWTEMTVAEQQREAKQTQNVHDLQESCCKTHAELEMKLEELKAVAGKMQAFDSVCVHQMFCISYVPPGTMLNFGANTGAQNRNQSPEGRPGDFKFYE